MHLALLGPDTANQKWPIETACRNRRKPPRGGSVGSMLLWPAIQPCLQFAWLEDLDSSRLWWANPKFTFLFSTVPSSRGEESPQGEESSWVVDLSTEPERSPLRALPRLTRHLQKHTIPPFGCFFNRKLDDEWPESMFHHVGSQSVSYLLSVQCEVFKSSELR